MSQKNCSFKVWIVSQLDNLLIYRCNDLIAIIAIIFCEALQLFITLLLFGDYQYHRKFISFDSKINRVFSVALKYTSYFLYHTHLSIKLNMYCLKWKIILWSDFMCCLRAFHKHWKTSIRCYVSNCDASINV